MKMMSFDTHLKEEMQNSEFRKMYQEEKYLLELGLKITEKRRTLGLSQKQLAKECRITQQQLSKIENGVNCNLLTFLRITGRLGLALDMPKAG
jgi:ribosome-binding protein aMBF1 (putative translation factor)